MARSLGGVEASTPLATTTTARSVSEQLIDLRERTVGRRADSIGRMRRFASVDDAPGMATRRWPAVLLLVWSTVTATTSASTWELTVEAPASLAADAARLRRVDREQLVRLLAGASLEIAPVVHVTLIPDADPLARGVPTWIVGRAFGARTIVILPDRIAGYPFGSLESVFAHELVHLALFARAGGRPLPRWFHEGVAVSVESGWRFRDNLRLVVAAASTPLIADLSQLFASDSRPDTTEAYLLAAALANDVRLRHGASVPGIIAGHVARGIPFERAFDMATGETPDEAAAHAWSAYRRWTAWLPAVTSGAAIWAGIVALALMAFAVRSAQRARRRRQWAEEEQRWERPV